MSNRLRIVNLGLIEYSLALNLQHALVNARMREEVEDTLLLLEHPHVYTLGRGADERFIIDPPRSVPIHRVSRGGQVTYHGPGQLVGYPIIKLEGAQRDVLRYLRKLEQVIIDALDGCGIRGVRRERLTGVWVGDRKIASIGVGIRRWVTLHGFAINVSSDLNYFDRIVPCGIEGCRMTSIADLGRVDLGLQQFSKKIAAAFAQNFGYREIAEIAEMDLMPQQVEIAKAAAH